MFDELQGLDRIDDPEKRDVGQILKSKKKSFFKKKTKSSSMSFNTYKFMKGLVTLVLGGSIIIGVLYLFYLGVKIFALS